MNQRAPSSALATLALIGSMCLVSCSQSKHDGVFVDFMVPVDQPIDERPDTVQFYWLRPLATGSPQGTVALTGSFAAAVDNPEGMLGTVLIGTDGAPDEARLLVAVGRINGLDGQITAGGSVLLALKSGPERVQVTLGAPLAETTDENPIPVLVKEACLADDPAACTAGDGGLSDGAASDGLPPAIDAAGVNDAAKDHAGDVVIPPADAGVDARSPLATGIVGYWKFDDATGKVAKDSSGFGNNGTLVGTPAWIPAGKVGGAIDITSTVGNGVVVASSASLDTISKGFSVAAWTFRARNKAGLSDVLSRRSLTPPDKELFSFTFIQNGSLRGYINTQTGTPVQLMTDTDAVAIGDWVHVAYTYDGASVRIYAGGVEQTSQAYTQAITGGTPICLGCGLNTADVNVLVEPLGGQLDEMILYNRALTGPEVKQLAAGTLP